MFTAKLHVSSHGQSASRERQLFLIGTKWDENSLHNKFQTDGLLSKSAKSALAVAGAVGFQGRANVFGPMSASTAVRLLTNWLLFQEDGRFSWHNKDATRRDQSIFHFFFYFVWTEKSDFDLNRLISHPSIHPSCLKWLKCLRTTTHKQTNCVKHLYLYCVNK